MRVSPNQTVDDGFSNRGTSLAHLDRVALGRFHLFRFHDDHIQNKLDNERKGNKDESCEGFPWFKAYEELIQHNDQGLQLEIGRAHV